MYHTNHSFAVDDAYLLANVLVDEKKVRNDAGLVNTRYDDVEENLLDKYEENRQRHLQAMTDIEKQAERLCHAK